MKFLSDILAKAGLTVDGVVTLNNTATGQTPAANDNSTKLATTAWVRTFVQPYSLPIASASILGGIKVGTGLSIDSGTGILSVTGASASSIKSTQTFVVTEGQTVFTVTNGYAPGLIDIFLNGVYLSPNQSTATNGSTFTLNDPAATGDVIDVIVVSPVYQGTSTTTDQLPEGVVNLYYTNARARAAITLTVNGSSGASTYSSSTGVLNVPTYTLAGLGGVVSTRTITINGVTYDLTANRSWSALPVGGTAGQLLAKVDGTDYNAQWINEAPAASYTSQIKHQVKAGQAITKGQAVYVSSADGTNMIVSKASNATEGTSSKTMGLLESTVSTNGFTNVIAEGLLSGLNTNGANAGDPVWLGTDGNLIYGLVNKPSAPAHLVFIGVVTRANANNGEIFVKVQNGFEMRELHDYVENGVQNNFVISYESSTSLYKPKSIATLLGYTPANAARNLTINGTTYDLTADRTWTLTTSVIGEGTNLYYTDARVGTYLTANSYATQSYVSTQINNLVSGAPGLLDTLDELAAALGDDPNFATTVSTALSNRLRIDIGTQGLTSTQQGFGRTNLGLGSLATLSSVGNANITDLAYSKLTSVPSTFAPSAHTHTISEVIGLQTALDGKEPTITAGTTAQYWRGDKSWQTLPIYTLSGLGGQPQLNGTGFVKVSGTTVSYDNSTYYLASNPNGYITGISFANVSAKPTTIAGYGITDSLVYTTSTYSNPSWITALAWSKITGAPAFITGYTETDTLASVTGRGASTSSSIIMSGGSGTTSTLMLDRNIASPSNYYSGLQFEVRATSGTAGIALHRNGFSHIGIYHDAVNSLKFDMNAGTVVLNHNTGTVWGTGNLTNLNQLSNGPGYITGYTETDTLATVTARGASTTSGITVNGRVLIETGGANTYGVVSGYNNNNHFMTMRGAVSGSTSSPTITGSHQMTFVEYAEGGDSTGWYFKSSSTGTYQEIARITRAGITWNGYNVIHSGNYNSYAPTLTGGSASGTWNININGSSSTSTSASYADRIQTSNTQWNWSTGAHTATNPNTITLWDQYSNYGGNGYLTSYATILDIHGRSGHEHDQLYFDSSGTIYHRNCFYGTNSWNGWRTMIDSSNIGSQSVSYASTAGSLSSMNISQFSNNSGYITSSGSISGSAAQFAGYGIGSFEGNFSTTIDASGLSASNYYPVTISVPANRLVKLSVRVALNSNVPSWAGHPSGFSVKLIWYTNGNGWGTNDTIRYIESYNHRFVSGMAPIGGLAQLTNSSEEVVWVRGGGVYYCYGSEPLTWTLRTSNYDNYGPPYTQTAAVTSSVVNDVWSTSTGRVSFGEVYSPGSIIAGYRLQTPDFTLGYWDGTNNRIEAGSGRPLLITSYGSSVKIGLSGDTHMTVTGSGVYAAKYFVNGDSWIVFNNEEGSWGIRTRTTTSTANLGSALKNLIYNGGGSNEGFAFTGNGTGAPSMEVRNDGVVWVKTDINVPNHYVGNYFQINTSRAASSHGYAGLFLNTQYASSNFVPFSFESEYGTHSWGVVARFRVRQGSADRPSIQFSSGTNDTRWNVGYCYSQDDNFRITQNMGYRNDNSNSDGWGTERFRINTDGATYCFSSFTASGDVTAYSDIRVKTDIQTVIDPIEKIKAIRGVTFKRTDTDDKDRKHLGVVAQEVMDVLPEVISETDKGLFTVAYGNMAGLFIEAIKEQQAQIESQKTEIEELKDLVKQLINR